MTSGRRALKAAEANIRGGNLEQALLNLEVVRRELEQLEDGVRFTAKNMLKIIGDNSFD